MRADLHRRASWATVAGVTAVLYALTARIFALLGVAPSDVSPLYPAAGLALAAVLVHGRAALVGVALGAMVANSLPLVTAGSGLSAWLLAALMSAGSVAQAALAAALVRRHVQQPLTLTEPRDIALFFGLGALLAHAGGCHGGGGGPGTGQHHRAVAVVADLADLVVGRCAGHPAGGTDRAHADRPAARSMEPAAGGGGPEPVGRDRADGTGSSAGDTPRRCAAPVRFRARGTERRRRAQLQAPGTAAGPGGHAQRLRGLGQRDPRRDAARLRTLDQAGQPCPGDRLERAGGPHAHCRSSRPACAPRACRATRCATAATRTRPWSQPTTTWWPSATSSPAPATRARWVSMRCRSPRPAMRSCAASAATGPPPPPDSGCRRTRRPARRPGW